MNGHDETAAASGTGPSHIPAVSSLHYMLQGAEHSSSNMGGSTVAVATAAAPTEEPPIKRLKLTSHAPPEDLRRRILDYKLLRLKTLRDRFTEQLSELYFLQAGGNMMDYAAWRRRPVAPQLQAFVDARRPAPVPTDQIQITTVVVTTGSSGAQDEAAATARQEARVCARVAELARQGLWTERRLPRVCEPPRNKTHWDYLLEEMAWLSHDFAHERKWKKHAAKKCARAVQKYFQDKAQAAQKAEKAQELQLRKVAAFAAKEIRTFWTNVEKLVEWKREQRLERERKQALDEQLSYIVDRTEQYSRQLAANLTTELPPGCPPSPARSDYSGAEDDADDETTIAAQERAEKPEDTAAEIAALQAEADLDIEELRKRYANPPPTTPSSSRDTDGDETTDIDSDDEETDAESDSSDDASEKLEALVEDPSRATAGTSNEDVEAASSLAASLQPTGTTLSSTAVATPVPKLLKHSLREYQHVGLHWLATMHQRSLNGILADEMGLGKTIQTIALLAHLAERGDWGPHLVVAPTSVVMNWEFEFKKWCPAFKILTYYGSIKERKLKRVGWTKYNSFHICITSYKLVVQDHQSFRRKRWHYLILDEAQNIKNFKSQRWQMLLNFQTERRLLLTGTPLQNSLLELWSLMHFLMPHVFASHSEFREWFGDVAGMAEGAPRHDPLLRRLHQVLRPFLLRRLKRDVERQLPRKYEHVLMCRLARRQRALYDDFMSRARTKDALASGNLLSVINVLMQLRKVCNHPDLFEPRPVSSPLSMEQLMLHLPALLLEYSAETMENVQRIARIAGDLATFEAEGVGAFVAHRARHLAPPKRLVEELTETPAPPRPPPCALRLHLRLVARTPPTLHRAPPNPPVVAFSAGSAAPKALTAAVTAPAATTGARARLEVRRKANLRRLATVNERRCWRLPLYGADLRAAVDAPPPAPPLEFAPKDLEAFVESMHDVITRFTVVAVTARAPSVRVWYGAGAADWRRRVDHIESAVEDSTKQALAALHASITRQSVAFPHPSLLQYDCGKLQRLATLLRQLKAGSHRVLIFTQMTRVLDVLESFLSRLGHTYLRLDGATKVDARQTIVERFNGDKRVFCMVLSTRSGGVGLNLTGADTVVFYDSDWNPTMDAQAQDRAHRIGQTRDVHVYRLVTAASVEENILRKAHQKRALSHLAIEDGHFTTSYLQKVNISDLFGSEVAETSEPTNSGETLESALAAVEEEADAAAARAAASEARAQLAEFDENVPLPVDAEGDNVQGETDPPELAALLQTLSPIEKYAMRMVECSEAATEADRAARDTVQRQRAEWEQARKRLQEEEPAPAPASMEQDCDLTYCREDASAKIWISEGGAGTKMPMWCPPTPPSSEGDVYCETWSRSLYRSGAAADCLLPAVTRREQRRARPARPAHAPPSLFERGGNRPRPRPRPPPIHPHQRDPPPLEWSPAEDAALRRALRLQRLPAEPPPALAPNWEWVSELVNEVARAYRSARSCRDRHDILADPERARRKHKRPPAARRRLDEDAPRPPLSKLDAMRDAAERRRSAPKRRTDDPQQHNPKHVALLADHGVDYESPPTPMEVAMRRADRIAKEKQKAGGTTSGPQQQPQTQTVVGPAPTPQVQTVATQRVVVAGPAKPTDARGRVRAGVPQPQLVYRQQPIGARHHLKLLHHPATPGQGGTPASGSGEVRTLQLHHLALRRATPAAGSAGTPHVVLAHLAPPPPPTDQQPTTQSDPRRQ